MNRTLLLSLSICLLAGACGRRPTMRDEPSTTPPETASPVERGECVLPVPVPASNEPSIVAASFSVAGRVAEIAVQPGAWVEAGQYVARLDLAASDLKREQLLAKVQESEREVEAARMAYLDLKQQAEAGAGNEEQMAQAEARFQQVAMSRGQALDALRQTQADSQRGILYAPVRGEVVAVTTALGSDVESQQTVMTIRQMNAP